MSLFKNKKYIFDGGMGQNLIDRGMISQGTLWSATALVDETLNKLVLDSHLDYISSGAEIIVTSNFKVRKNTFSENRINHKFDLANKRAGEIAFEAKKITKKKSNKDILIAGSIPTRGITYQPHQLYDEKLIYEEFFQVAKELNPYIDFFYLDVLCSSEEIVTALSALKNFNKTTLLGLHFKKDFLLPSGESVDQISKVIKNFDCAGLMTSCVSPEIYLGVLPKLKTQKLSYGFAINAFVNIPDKIELNKDYSLQPNNFLGLRDDITPKKYAKIAKDAYNNGAKFLKGCCNITPAHIEQLSKSMQ